MIAVAGLSSGSSWVLSSGGLGPDPQGGIDRRIGLVFGVVRIPTAFLGSRPVSQPSLLLAFAGLTLITAASMLLPGPRPDERPNTPVRTHSRTTTEAGASATSTTTPCRQGPPRPVQTLEASPQSPW